MDSPTQQPSIKRPRSTVIYVTIVIASCAAAAALGFLARSFLRPTDAIARLLPSVNTVLFVRSTDISDLKRWTSGPLIRSLSSGSGSTASGSSLSSRINAFHGKFSREAEAFVVSTPTEFSSLTMALLRTGTAAVSGVVIAEFGSETGAISAMTSLVDTGRNNETTLEKEATAEIRPVHLGKGAIAGFATRIGSLIVFSGDQAAVRSVLATSKDDDLALSASRAYVAGRLSEAPGYRAYFDYPKTLATLKSTLQSDRTWRDIFTLLSPLESNITSIHAAMTREGEEYRLRTRIMATAKASDALLGTPEDRNAPALPGSEEVLLAISGYDLLQGYRRFSQFLGATEADSGIVLEALSRFFLSTYITPQLSPVTLSDISRGGYSFAMVATGSGSTASYGWVGMDQAKITPTQVEGWFTDFTSDSRLMFTERLRPMRIGDGESAPERYLAPLPSEQERVALQDGTILYSTKTGTSFSPSVFLRDGRLYFSSSRSLSENLANGDLGDKNRNSPSGAWSLRIHLSPLLHFTLGPVDGMRLWFSRGNGGLRIDGLLSTVK